MSGLERFDRITRDILDTDKLKKPVSKVTAYFQSFIMVKMKISIEKGTNKSLRLIAVLSLLFMFASIGVSVAQEPQEYYVLLWSYEIEGKVTSVSISADGSYIAVGSEDNRVYLLDRDEKLLWSYETDFPITDVSISADGSYLVAGGAERGGIIPAGMIYLFNKEGECLRNLKSKAVSSVSISADGSYMAFTYLHGLGWNDVVILYSRDGNYLWHYTIGWDETGDVSLSRDGKYTAVGSAGQGLEKEGIHLYNKEGKLLWNYEEIDTDYIPQYSVAISADGSYIIAGNDKNDKVHLLDRNGELLWSYVTGHVEEVSISPDGDHVTVGSGNTVYLFNFDGKLLWSHETDSSVSDVSVSAGGNTMVLGCQNNKVYFYQKLQIAAQNALKKAHDAISQEKSKGFIVETPESLLVQAEAAFNSGDYGRAKELAEQSESKALEIDKEADDASSSISRAKLTIPQVKSKGFIVEESESLLSQAEEAFDYGDYGRAKELAEQSESKALEIDKEADDASSSISRAKLTIPQVKSEGFIVVVSESLLSQAEEAFNSGDYSRAKELADVSYALAIDVDQDGIPNAEDFAPTTKNIHIYIGCVILFLISVSFAGVKIKRRGYEKKIKEYSDRYELLKAEGPYEPDKDLEELLK